jgi:arginine decarboxylase
MGKNPHPIGEQLAATVELATHATLCSCSAWASLWSRWSASPTTFAETVRRISRTGESDVVARTPSAIEQEAVVPIREAFFGAAETVTVDAAIGRVSCESIAGYPLGVPALLPGERITAEVVDYLRELVAVGARLHGAADPTFTTVRVLAGR